MRHMAVTVGILLALLGTTALATTQKSYAHVNDSAEVPQECEPFVGAAILNKEHDLTVTNEGNILPGEDVTVEATFEGPTAVDHVRFLWYDGSGSLVRNENVPKPIGPAYGKQWSLQDTFSGVYGPNTEWTVIACFISENNTVDVNALHLDLTTFFVLPESAIGALAVVGSGLAVFGGFTTLFRRKKD